MPEITVRLIHTMETEGIHSALHRAAIMVVTDHRRLHLQEITGLIQTNMALLIQVLRRLNRHIQEDHRGRNLWEAHSFQEEDQEDRSFREDRKTLLRKIQLRKAHRDRQQSAGYHLLHGRQVDKVSRLIEAGYGS